MDYEAFKDYENSERESQTEKEWEEMDGDDTTQETRNAIYDEGQQINDMLDSKEWNEWVEDTTPKKGHSLAWYMGMKGVIN